MKHVFTRVANILTRWRTSDSDHSHDVPTYIDEARRNAIMVDSYDLASATIGPAVRAMQERALRYVKPGVLEQIQEQYEMARIKNDFINRDDPWRALPPQPVRAPIPGPLYNVGLPEAPGPGPYMVGHPQQLSELYRWVQAEGFASTTMSNWFVDSIQPEFEIEDDYNK